MRIESRYYNNRRTFSREAVYCLLKLLSNGHFRLSLYGNDLLVQYCLFKFILPNYTTRGEFILCSNYCPAEGFDWKFFCCTRIWVEPYAIRTSSAKKKIGPSFFEFRYIL